MSKNYNRALAFNTKMVEKNNNKEGKVRNQSWDGTFQTDNKKLLDEYWVGCHSLTRDTQGTAQFTIRDPSFKLRIEPVGKMTVKRIPRYNGMEYNFTFAGDEEYTYIRSVFEAFCILVKRDVEPSSIW